MSIDLQAGNKDLLSCELAKLADNWAGLGAWCTVWDAQARPVGTIPQTSMFWKTIWNKGQGFRNEVSRAISRCKDHPTSAPLLNIEGAEIHCLPIEDPSRKIGALAVCCLRDHCRWTEECSRLCSQWHLDEQLLRRWFDHQPRFSEDGLGRALALIQQSSQGLLNLVGVQMEVCEMTAQLTDAYEELNLIYRVGAMMHVTQQPRAYFTQLFEDLAKTTPFTTMAAVLYDTEVLDPDNRLIIGGEPIVDEPGVLQIVDVLHSKIEESRNALIINHPQEYPKLDWTRSWLERAIVVPIICSQSLMGVVLVFNHSRDVDFNSTDVRLLHSVIDRSAIYLENVFLYGDLNNLLMGLLHALVSSIDAKDPYTCGHSNRVALISQSLAEKTGVSPLQAERFYLAGLLHDVGKIGISELILCKPGRLTPEETQEMKKHPEIGMRILSGITQLNDIMPAVMHHHEWISGQGYPAGLAGDDIPWIAKVVGLADGFDAMTTGRQYRDALVLEAAMAEIRRYAGTQFCPKLADALVALVDEGLVERLKSVRTTTAFDSVYTKWVRRAETIS